MFGVRAVELIRELDRLDDDQLLPYNGNAVNEILREINEHRQQINAAISDLAGFENAAPPVSMKKAAAILVHDSSVLRNKRCVMAFLHHRFRKIKQLRWQLGAVLPEELETKLSPSEKEAFKSYSDKLAAYMGAIGMDLTVDVRPPKDPYIEVRVLEPTGPLLVDDKVVHLTPNSVHLLKRVDAEPLILQGFLEQRQF